MSTITYDARLQQFALERLRQVSEKRRKKAEQIARLYPAGLPENRIGDTCRLYVRLLDRAIYSMYIDCLEAGVGQDARVVLGELR